MPLRVLVVSGRTDVEDMLRDDPGAESYRLERRPPHLVEPGEVARDFPVVLIDFATTPDPVTLGRALRASQRAIEFIPVVSLEQERLAVDAVKFGAFDYLVWPPNEAADLWTVVARALKKANPSPPRPFPRPFGKYRLMRKLGEGGMAEVFLAEQTLAPGAPPREVVVKRMHDNLAAGEEFVKMFADEARISSSLVHPNIVRVFDFGKIDESLYIVMEYISGRNLEELRRGIGGPFPPALACHIVAEICAGLGHAHARVDKNGVPMNIVHRDVNPPNVLIADDGRVMITDFGIAKATHRFYETTSGTLKGKFEYMSPEQANGQPVDRRADLFCAGLVLYELLSGTRPFLASTPIETLFLIQQCKPEPPSKHNTRLPPVLDKIVMMALAKDPNIRYQEAGEMERHLREYARKTTNPGPRDLAVFAKGVAKQSEIVEDDLSLGRTGTVHPKPAPPSRGKRSDAAPTSRVPPPPTGREVTTDLGPSEPSETSVTVEVGDRTESREIPAPDSAARSPSGLRPAVPSPDGKEPQGKDYESSLVDLRQLIVGDMTDSSVEIEAIPASEGPESSASTAETTTEGPPLPVPTSGTRRPAVVPGMLTLPETVDDPIQVTSEETVIRPLDEAGRPRAPAVDSEPKRPQPTGSGGELFPPEAKAADAQWRRMQIGAAAGGAIFVGILAIAGWKLFGRGSDEGVHTPVAVITAPPIPVFSVPAVAPTQTAPATATSAPTASFIRATPPPTVAPTAVAAVRTARPFATPRPTSAPSSLAEIPTIAVPSPTRVAVAARGGLSVWVDGWANVYVDGVRIAQPAPFADVPVAAGKHRVTLENGARHRDYEVVVAPGKSTVVNGAFK